MTINNYQIGKLNDYILEGNNCIDSALEGKKSYIKRVQEWLRRVCNDNSEKTPYWVDMLDIPVMKVRPGDNEINEVSFYNDKIKTCLESLEQLRAFNYIQNQLSGTQEQLQYTRKSLRISIYGLIASISIPIIISIVTINCCTNTVKIEEQQFQKIKTELQRDNIILK